jgi:glycosyltransferase involved in cell wall biosynthesis
VSKAKIICVATGIFPPDTGGPAKFAETFLKWCQQNGQRVEAVSLTDTATKDISFENANVKLISRNQFLFNRYIKTILALSRKLLTRRAVIANGLFLEVYFASLLTNRNYTCKVPGDIVWERARNSGYTSKSLADFQNETLNTRYKLFRDLFSRSLRRANKVIVPTRQLQELCINWGVHSEKILVIPNSVDTLLFSSDDNDKRLFDVISVGRLIGLKNIKEVIHACTELNLSLAVVGDGPERSSLERVARELSSNTVFYGNQEQENVLKLLRSSSCFVLNSSGEGGTPYSLLEARSVGLFSVATQGTGSSEVINHLVDGLLCGENGPTLREALKIFVRDKHFVYEAKNKAIMDTRIRFDSRVQFKRILDVVIGES